jgi:hypothetical protein
MARITHLRDALKNDFFKHLSTLNDLLSANDIEAAAIDAHYSWRDRVWNPVMTVWTFLIQVLHPDAPCRQAVAAVLAEAASESGNSNAKTRWESKISPDPSAYCQARGRLPLAVFKAAFNQVGHRLQEKIQDSYRWCGRRIWMADGSTVSMPDTPPLQKAFGQPPNQKPGCGFPMARIVALFAWASGTVLDVAIGRWGQSELPLLYSIWGLLEQGDILLADRLFCTYRTLSELVQRGCDGVFRLNGPRSRALDFRKGRRLGRDERVVTWRRPNRGTLRISSRQWRRLPEALTVRLIRFHTQVPGYRSQRIILATTLLDPKAYPLEEVVALYRDRWTVELRLREIKTTLKMDVLRCKSEDAIRKEILMHLLAYNLIRALMWQASEAHGRELHRVSFAGTVQRLEVMAPYLWLFAGTCRATRLYALLLEWIARDRLPYRPGRIEPRVVKRRPKSYDRLDRPRCELRAALLRQTG